MCFRKFNNDEGCLFCFEIDQKFKNNICFMAQAYRIDKERVNGQWVFCK